MPSLEPKSVDFKENFIPWLKASFSLFKKTQFFLIPATFFFGFIVVFFDYVGSILSDLGNVWYFVFDPIITFTTTYIMSSVIIAIIFTHDDNATMGDTFIDTYKIKESIKVIIALSLGVFFFALFFLALSSLFIFIGDLMGLEKSELTQEEVKPLVESTFIRDLSIGFTKSASIVFICLSLLIYINSFPFNRAFSYLYVGLVLNINTLLKILFLDIAIFLIISLLPNDSIIFLVSFLLYAVFSTCFVYILLQHIFFDIDPNAHLKKKATEKDESTVGQLT